MSAQLHALAHEIAREQIAHWRAEGWTIIDVGIALSRRSNLASWRDAENAIAMAWRRLPLYRRFEKVAA